VKYSAGGLRDFTRIAASNPVMWRDIFIENKDNTSKLISKFIENLESLKKAIEDGISLCNTIPGRMETFSLYSGATAIVDYAHTPDAYTKVLSTIKELMIDSEANIYVVFGCGGNRDKSKRSIMGAIVEQFATHSFITPDNPRNEKISVINQEIINGFKKNNFDVFLDREKGLKTALNKAVKNDIVIALGKGREDYQEMNNELIPYSDINIINEYSHEN